MKAWLYLGAGVFAAGFLLAAPSSQAGTSDVYRLQTVIRGVTQWDLNNNPCTPRAANVQIRDVDLINLGLGQPLTNPVPANEHLALVTQCASDDMRIIVYDGTNNLVTIGRLQRISKVDNLPGKLNTRNVIAELTFTNLTNAVTFATANGSVSNCLAGGTFLVAGSILSDSEHCLISYHANILGEFAGSFFFTNTIVTNIVDITVTNTITNTYYSVSNFTVNVASTVLTAGGKKLGTLIEP